MLKIDIAKFPTRTSNAVVWVSLLAAITVGLLGPNLGWWEREGSARPDRPGLSAPYAGPTSVAEQIAAADAIRILRYADTELNEAWKRILVRRGTPKLETWIRETHARIRTAGTEPIPLALRNRLAVYFKPHEFVNLRFAVDADLVQEARSASYDFSNEEAVCLVDVIVFRDWNVAMSDLAWARELALCRRFGQWGVERFARRYLEDWRSIVTEIERDKVRYAQLRYGPDEPVVGRDSVASGSSAASEGAHGNHIIAPAR
jgi:hypothetical protein